MTYAIIIGAGQSNMSGRGELDPDGRYDQPHPRLWQMPSDPATNVLTPARVPLAMHDQPTGLSPLTVFGHLYAADHPDDEVIMVPAAHGGTGFTTTSITPPPPGLKTGNEGGGTWQLHRDEPINLARCLTDQIRRTLAIAAQQVTTSVFLWHQGEADSTLTTSEYAAYFDELATAVRAACGHQVPVIVGGMAPEYLAENPSRLPVHHAHIDTPRRLKQSAYAPPRSGGAKPNDPVHFARQGVIDLAHSMYRAYRRLPG